jgi:predicted ATPase
MFTQLRIQNFKAWKDTGNIRLAPLTVFFGPNSSGKTSLLQFLLLLNQTVQSPDRKQVLNFGGSHTLIDFGVWPEMVFGGDAAGGLRFEFSWRVPDRPRAEGKEQGSLDGACMDFEAAIGPTSAASIGIREFRYSVTQPMFGPVPLHLGIQYDEATRSYKLTPVEHRLRRTAGARKIIKSAPSRFYGFPDEVSARWEVLDDLELELEAQLDSTLYLGPLREASARLYTWPGDAPTEVGFSGENTIAALLAAQDRVLQGADDSKLISFGELLAKWLVRIGLLESFEAKPIVPEARIYQVVVRTPGSRRQVNLADVGFGVSQVLPVLVQLLYADWDTTLVFEQPELHLHPRVQAELADLFIETIKMKQDEKLRGIQCIVESHSEHFLRRLQRRIAEGVLLPEQTALYFCKPGPDGSSIEELQVDKYGRISNWPENFFGDAIGDTEEQMDAMLRRMEQEEPSASG